MEVGVQFHAPAALIPAICWIGGWMGPRAGLDAVEKIKNLAPDGNRIPAVQSTSLFSDKWQHKFTVLLISTTKYRDSVNILHLSLSHQVTLQEGIRDSMAHFSKVLLIDVLTTQ
jgi:hypothetical protein